MGLFERGERQEKLIIVTLVQVFDEVSQNGEFRKDLIHFGCTNDLEEQSFVSASQRVSSSSVCTFFLRSTRLRASALLTTVSATKSL